MLSGRFGGGLPGRLNLKKALIVVAAQEDGPGIGRIRMRKILDASPKSLVPFVRDSVAPDSVIHPDGWLGYLPLKSQGYRHDVNFLQGKKKTPSEPISCRWALSRQLARNHHFTQNPSMSE
jgi:hypothetical protein